LHKANLTIGRKGNSDSGYFNGSMCDMKIWTGYTLSLSEIQEIYKKPEQSAPSASLSYLSAWYPMSEANPESPQSIVYDHSEKGLGSELSNKDFTGWTLGGSSNWSASSATSLSHTASASGYASSPFSTSSGKLYKVSITINSGQTSTYKLQLGGSSWLYDPVDGNDTWSGSYTFYVSNAGNSSNGFKIYAPSGFVGTFTDVSVKEVLMGNHATTNFFEEQVTNGDMASEPTINGQNITHSNSSHIRQAGPLGGQSWIMTVTNGSGGGDSYLKVKPLDSSLIGATMNISIKLYKVSAFSSLQVRYIKEDTNPVNIGSAITDNDTWTTVTGTVPADATGSSNFQPINVVAAGGSAGSQYYVDEISVKVVGISSTGFATAQNEPVIPQIPLVKYNEKMLFTGYDSSSKDDRVDFSAVTLSGDFTLSFWYMQKESFGWTVIFYNSSNESLYGKADGVFQLRFGDSTYKDFSFTSELNTLRHFVFTRSSGTIKLYVNGVEQSDNESHSGDFVASRIGHTGYSIEGFIDEVSMFNSSMSTTQAQELFNDGVALDATTHSKFIDTTDLLGGSYDFTNATQWNQISNANRTSATSITATSDNGSIRTTTGSFESDTRLYKISIQGSVTTGNITLKSWGGQETWKTGITGTFNETVYATTSYGGLMIILTANTAVATITSLKIERQYCAGYWRNDGVTTWTDRSGVGNTGTVAGTPDSITIREGLNSKDGLGFPLTNPTSNIVRFSRNGLAEHLSIPNSKAFDIQGSFTVEFWMKQPDMGSGYQQVINRDDTSNRNWSVQSINGQISLGYYSGGSFSNTQTSGTYDDDKWHHVCAILTSGTSVQIYVDTVLVKLNTSSIPTTIDNDPAVLNIGKRTGTTQFFIGSIDEVRFYNKALTAFEADGSTPEEGETAVSGEVVKNYKHGKGKHKND
jgi:hypothetical protein